VSRALSWKEYRETASKAEVLRQLVALGYEITQRSFYRHCQQGKCRLNEEGFFSRRLVKAYVESAGLIRNGESATDNDSADVALSIEKQQKEIDKLDWHNKTAALNYKKAAGLLIEREGVYLEIAARSVALDSSFTVKIKEEEAPRLIAAVGGDLNKLPEFQDLLQEAWDDLMNSFCTTDTFEVLFEDEDLDVDQLLSVDVGNQEEETE